MTLPNIDDSNEPATTEPQDQLSGRPTQDQLAERSNVDDFEFVRLPDGSIRAVPKADIREVPETATQDAPATVMVPVEDPHFYVWLANGDVIRVKESDLPGSAGTNAAHGHWQKDGNVYLIVAVYPVEDKVKES